jgi:hypothetical protein
MAGGLDASQLTKYSDIWIIARDAQLIDNNDPVVRLTARPQLSHNLFSGFDGKTPNPLPFSDYLSGSGQGGLHDIHFYKCGSNTWSRAPGNQLEGLKFGLMYPAMNRPK